MNLRLRQSTWFDSPNVWFDDPTVLLWVEKTGSSLLDIQQHSRQNLARYLDLDLTTCSSSHIQLAQYFAEAVLSVQRSVGLAVSCSHIITETGESGEFVVTYCDSMLAQLAIDIVMASFNEGADVSAPESVIPDKWKQLETMRQIRFPYDVSLDIVNAAESRSIPWSFVDPRHQLIELGTGVWRTRVDRSVTDRTSVNGVRLAANKSLTSHYLREAGIPVPTSAATGSIRLAAHVAEDIGYPVTIKPNDGSASAGLTLRVETREEFEPAFEKALAASARRLVLVERFIPGRKYRVTVVNHQITSILQLIQAEVIGDGSSTVQWLINALNADPKRGDDPTFQLRTIKVDNDLLQTLAGQGHSLDSVPAAEEIVQMKFTSRRDEGVEPIDVTDLVHPETSSMLIQAVGVIGLDVATLDFIAEDIARSCWQMECGIVDINTGSGFFNELNPIEGEPRSPGPAIVDMLFPRGRPARAPVTAVMAGHHSDLIASCVTHLLTEAGKQVGLVRSDKIEIGGIHFQGVDHAGNRGPQIVFANPSVEHAVFAVDPAIIVSSGLGFDYCDVAIIPTVSAIASAFNFGPPEKVLCRVLGTTGIAILDADDPASTLLASACKGEVIYISRSETHPVVTRHLAEDGRAIVMSGASIISKSGDHESRFDPGRLSQFDSLVQLSIVAAATALDMPIDVIVRSISSTRAG